MYLFYFYFVANNSYVNYIFDTFVTLVIILLLLSTTLIIYWRQLSIGFGKSKEYVVYKDLKEKGFYVTTGFKYGADFFVSYLFQLKLN